MDMLTGRPGTIKTRKRTWREGATGLARRSSKSEVGCGSSGAFAQFREAAHIAHRPQSALFSVALAARREIVLVMAGCEAPLYFDLGEIDWFGGWKRVDLMTVGAFGNTCNPSQAMGNLGIVGIDVSVRTSRLTAGQHIVGRRGND